MTNTGHGDNRAHEAGQTLVFMTVFIAVIFAFMAVVIDGGNYLLVRRNLQGNADAAALAAARELTQSQAQAQLVAEDYITTKNAGDGAVVDSIDFPSSDTMTVTVQRTEVGQFLKFFGMNAPTIRATATVQVRMMGARAGMLPLAFMRDSYTIGQNAEIKSASAGTSNRGAVSPDNDPPSCNTSNGANDFRNLIKGSANGGIDACAHAPGDQINTEPGNMSGPTRQGFDDRIGSNTDSFDDVFTYDATTYSYIVSKPDSPRLGIVPVIENTNGTNNWPNGKKKIKILYYMVVYIGKTDDSPDYPAYTDNGKSVWVTPVRAVMPADWEAEGLMDFDEDSDAPTVISLVG